MGEGHTDTHITVVVLRYVVPVNSCVVRPLAGLVSEGNTIVC